MLLFGFMIRFCIFALMAKGRDKDLIELRDKKLFERYYYWSEVQRLRFDDTIRKLAFDEFFLSEATTLRIIKRMLVEGATVDGKTIKIAVIKVLDLHVERKRRLLNSPFLLNSF